MTADPYTRLDAAYRSLLRSAARSPSPAYADLRSRRDEKGAR